MRIRAAVLEELGRLNRGFELMEAQDGIRSVIAFD
jgi:hypothetical protein